MWVYRFLINHTPPHPCSHQVMWSLSCPRGTCPRQGSWASAYVFRMYTTTGPGFTHGSRVLGLHLVSRKESWWHWCFGCSNWAKHASPHTTHSSIFVCIFFTYPRILLTLLKQWVCRKSSSILHGDKGVCAQLCLGSGQITWFCWTSVPLSVEEVREAAQQWYSGCSVAMGIEM